MQRLEDLVFKCNKYTAYLKNKIESVPKADFLNSIQGIFTQELFDYQVDGLQWLISLYEVGANGILGDEMGLGKTIQIIAMISFLISKGIKGPFLIVAPLSTIANWRREFKKFAPTISVFTYYIHTRARTKEDMKNVRKIFRSTSVILTSYTYPLMDSKLFFELDLKLLVVDEGHRLRSAESDLHQLLANFKSAHKVLLTGTPVNNNSVELWALLHFLMPALFNNRKSFLAWFDAKNLCNDNLKSVIVKKTAEKNILDKFYQVIKPFVLRRTKDVLKKITSLPPKLEIIIWSPITKLQAFLYKIQMDNQLRTYAIEKKAPFDESIELSNPYLKEISKVPWVYKSASDKGQMKHRNIVNHPYLICMPESLDFDTGPGLVSFSGKMVVLEGLLRKLLPKGHKILIFTQFKIMANIIADFLELNDIRFVSITGENDIEERIESIDEFQTSQKLQIFILTTRSGGLGLNLPAADTVIFYDTDWNPQVDAQAQDRCHRYGQKQPVVIYRLLCASTYDERMLNVATGKQRLFKALMHKTLDQAHLLMPDQHETNGNNNGNGEIDHTKNESNGNINVDEYLNECLTAKVGDIVFNEYKNGIVSDELLEEITDRKKLFKGKKSGDEENKIIEFTC